MTQEEILVDFRRALKALESVMGPIEFCDSNGYPIVRSADIDVDGQMRHEE